jgi:hypothetical protein
MFTLAANEQCSHCKRFVGIVNQIPALQQQMNLLTDVSKMKNELGITHVPTLITQDGQRYEGEKAFLWLKRQIQGMGGDPAKFSLGDVPDPDEGGASGGVQSTAIRVGVGIVCAIGAYYLLRRMMGSGSNAQQLIENTPSLDDAGF